MVLVIVLHANIEFAKTETFVFGNLSYPMVWANLQNIFRFSSQSDVSQIRPFIHNFTLQKIHSSNKLFDVLFGWLHFDILLE